MKIVILDGYTANPGDLSWKPLNNIGELTVYDRSRPEQTVERAKENVRAFAAGHPQNVVGAQ